MIPAFVKTRPTWEMQPFVRLTYPSEKAALGLPAAMQSKAPPTLDATPWFWDAWSQLLPGGTCHSFSNGSLSVPWHQHSWKS